MTQALEILMKYTVTQEYGLRLWEIVNKFIKNADRHVSGRTFKAEAADCWDIPSQQKFQSRDTEIRVILNSESWDPHPGIFENIP